MQIDYRKIIKIVISFHVIVPIVIGTAMGLVIAARGNLPSVDLLENYKPSTITRIYDVNNEVIAEFYHQRRTVVPLSSMPDHLIKAVLAVEDSDFYKHRGLDFSGIARAMWRNIMAGRIKEGGSTITQQLSKLLFFTPERSFMRKLKEAILALRIERRYTKDEILELYLNQVYLGGGAYGVESASRRYFGKGVSDLNLAEASLIAGLLRAPSAYSPLKHPERAKRRRSLVLRRMVKEDFITREQAQEVNSELLNVVVGGGERINRAPYFVEYIRQYLEENYEREDIYNNGLEVYTTLNLKYQKAAQLALGRGLIEVSKRRGFRLPSNLPLHAGPFLKEGNLPPEKGDILTGVVEQVVPDGLLVRMGERLGRINLEDMEWAELEDHIPSFYVGDTVLVKVLASGDGSADFLYQLALEQEPLVEGALVALDPSNGYIRAMVGGYDYYRSQFNRVIQAMRQPGSAFKPVIYAAAIDKGYRTSDIIMDSPIVYRDRWTGEVWKPTNFQKKFYGPVTVRHALEHSRNAATVNLLIQLKPEVVIEYARKMGIESHIDPFLSMALGSFEVHLLELTSAYAVLAGYGIHAQPMAIRYITDRDGQILEENFPKLKNVLSPHTSFIVTRMLQGAVQRGTGWRVKALEKPAAGKTGTTDKYGDAWFIGYTPQLVTGVWVGMDDHTEIGVYETGSRAASPIWLEFMKEALKDTPTEDFVKPEGITQIKIDALSGLLPTENCDKTVIKEVFVEGTEPRKYCPDKNLTGDGTGSTETQFYQR